MSTHLGRAAGALLVAALLGACSTTQPPSVQIDDARIHTELTARLAADDDTSPASIDINVNEGVVHLTGAVDSAVARDEAERIARSLEGVREVVNDISVGGEQTLGEKVDDAAVTARVKAKIAASSQLNPFNIQVNTVDGVVSLTGRVHSAAEKAEAERLARETEGVRRVRNLLEVGDLT
jgi:osmotically-inducible protein OsmY